MSSAWLPIESPILLGITFVTVVAIPSPIPELIVEVDNVIFCGGAKTALQSGPINDDTPNIGPFQGIRVRLMMPPIDIVPLDGVASIRYKVRNCCLDCLTRYNAATTHKTIPWKPIPLARNVERSRRTIEHGTLRRLNHNRYKVIREIAYRGMQTKCDLLIRDRSDL